MSFVIEDKYLKTNKEQTLLISLTYRCSMNCSHCMSSCTPDGQDMSIRTLVDVLKFAERHKVPAWNFSGGEIFEHKQIEDVLICIESELLCGRNIPKAVVFGTNGRVLANNRTKYNRFKEFIKKSPIPVMVQVTDDYRYYPEKLTDRDRYWLNKLGAIIEAVPGDPDHIQSCLYPQGRALENFPNHKWYTVGPKCSNCRLLAKQITGLTFTELLDSQFKRGKLCTPAISPEGYIKLGESQLCPKCSSIYDSDNEIIQSIKNFNCNKCKIAWDVLKEKSPTAYSILQGV